MLAHVLGAIAVPRLGAGRARNRPDAVLPDKAYSSRAIRRLLRSAASPPSSRNHATSKPTANAEVARAAGRSSAT